MKYRTRSAIDPHDWDYFEPPNHIEVDAPRGPIRTGLIDPHGDEIYRIPEPIGFKLSR
jgi:hypothetical protein